MKTITYQEMTDALAKSQAEMPAAECHGMCCGVLCATGQLNVDAMAMQLTGGSENAAVDTIAALLKATIAQLTEGEFSLKLLLPDEEASLAERSTALGLWCQGFVMGLSAGGVNQDTSLQKDTRELLMDFTNITHALQEDTVATDMDGDEEEEAAYYEVEEYVRVGVMLINEELRAQRPDSQVH